MPYLNYVPPPPLSPVVASQVLATLFAIAGCAKAFAPKDFFDAVAAYRILPSSYAPVIGCCIIVAEIATALALPFRATEFVAAIVGLTLLTVFTVSQLWVLLVSREEVACGCFGSVNDDPVSWKTLLRNTLLLALVALFLLARQFVEGSRPELFATLACRATVTSLVIQCFAVRQIIENRSLNNAFNAYEISVKQSLAR